MGLTEAEAVKLLQLASKFSFNTTIGAIVTNANLDKASMNKVAAMASNGVARTIRPVNTSMDGDSIYAMSVGKVKSSADVVGTLAAYVLAFKDFPGKNLFIFLALATLMIPSYITLVPEYLLVVKLKGTNTYWALIVPFLASGMGISLFRSHFLGLSRELEESAKIDGASDLRVYLTIVMPISKPVIGTMTILKAMWSWNQYMWPLIVAKDYEKQTIQVALKLFSGPNMTDWGYLCAGMTMAIAPLVIVFLCAQKQFIGGLQAGAVKG